MFVLAGYTVPLLWTGFRDNTAWDWLKLLLLPVLLPTVVIPLLTSRMRRSLGADEGENTAQEPVQKHQEPVQKPQEPVQKHQEPVQKPQEPAAAPSDAAAE